MCFNYEGTAAVYQEQYRKARKAHTCTGCDRGIKPRDHYWHVDGFCKEYENWFHTNECEACRFHRALIYAEEKSEGCFDHESWVPLEELSEELSNRGWYLPGGSDVWKPEDGEHQVVRRQE